MPFWRDLIAELDTPSNQVGPLHAAYERGVIGMGHGLVGALLGAVAGLFGAEPWLAALIVAPLYWLGKEVGDLRRGGTVADGAEDAACVGLGALYSGPVIFPAGMLAMGLWLMWRGYAQGNR